MESGTKYGNIGKQNHVSHLKNEYLYKYRSIYAVFFNRFIEIKKNI